MGSRENKELKDLELEKEVMKAELSSFQSRYAKDLLGFEGDMINKSWGKKLKVSKKYIWKRRLKDFLNKFLNAIGGKKRKREEEEEYEW